MSETQKDKRFSYIENSNIIYRSERREQGPKSDVVSLTQIHSTSDLLRQMGDRVDRSLPAELMRLKESVMERKRKQHNESDPDQSARPSRRRRVDGPTLSEIDILYKPMTRETQDAYAVFLTEIKQISNAEEMDVLREYAHELLQSLRNTELNIVQKRRATAKLFKISTDIDSSKFSRLYNISQKLTDFKSEADIGTSNEGQEDGEGEALTVNFDDMAKEENEEGDAVSFYEVTGDQHGDDGFDQEDGKFDDLLDPEFDDLLDDESFAKSKSKSKAAKEASDKINPSEIDGYWLERQLAGNAKTSESKDAQEPENVQDLANKTLDLLEDADITSAQLENALLRLIGLDNFPLIKKILQNRWAIFFCIKYHRAATPGEREKIREEIETYPSLSHIQESLFGSSVGKNVPEKTSSVKSDSASARREAAMSDNVSSSSTSDAFWKRPSKTVDVEELEQLAGTPDLTPDVTLPENAVSLQKKGYQEIHIPAAKAPPMAADERLIPIEEIPAWAHPAFKNMRNLNRIQSKLYKTALFSPENMLVCAPTGAGKTNCAMLTMLREIGKAQITPEQAASISSSNIENKDEDAPFLDLDAFKIVYVAPMKSLVQEVVLNFGNRLKPFGITVRELSGDAQLSRAEIAETQVIVTTPEKWDIVTRKDGEARAITRAVKLVIIDEIHLLHDSRGHVIESIVARSHRQTETWMDHTRIVGLSATLPNYEDVALFLRVKLDTGLFHFTNAYRPCPLQQQFIGITHKRAIARQDAMNTLTYEKTVEQLSGPTKHQVLIFVHSRKDTIATAKMLRDTSIERGELDSFLMESDSDLRKVILQEAANEATHPALKELIPLGIAFHHAGMSRPDRTLVEDLFAAQHVLVLVSTATLAWGVNLPAHTVIIKGTQVYSPEKGRWVELSPQDITQMIGRAGRPQYDTYGEGILITNHSHMLYYLALMNNALNIESQFLGKLCDTLNAEVVAGTIKSISDATRYLGYTFLYVRMLQMQNNALYGTSFEMIERDPDLDQYRTDLSHSAALTLAKGGLITYDRKSGSLFSTPLGRVAAHYYLSHQSAESFSKTLSSNMSDIEMFRAFSFSGEFANMSVRGDEKMELVKLLDRVPIPVRESPDSGPAKANVLLQVYISRQSIDGFAINADLSMVAQSAGRLSRAIFEICLANKWAKSAERALSLCKMISRRMWPTLSPLRQFPLDNDIAHAVQRLESLEKSWSECLDLDATTLSELIRLKEENSQANAMRKRLISYIHKVPHIIPTVEAQPLSHNTLAVALTIECDFTWDTPAETSKSPAPAKKRSNLLASEGYWLVVEDSDGSTILHSEYISLRQENPNNPVAQGKYNFFFVLPVSSNPLPPHYMTKLYSDKWFGGDVSVPISLRKIILPEVNPPLTELLDLLPTSVVELQNPDYISFFSKPPAAASVPLTLGRVFFRNFNAIQTQVFDAVYRHDDNVYVAAPVGSGKTVIAELAIMQTISAFKSFVLNSTKSKMQSEEEDDENEDENEDSEIHHARCVYLTPFAVNAKRLRDEWSVKFGNELSTPVRMLTGDSTADITLFTQATVVISTYENFYNLTKKWSLVPINKKAVNVHTSALLRSINLIVPSDMHFIHDPEVGPLIELTITNIRFIAAELRMRAIELQRQRATANSPSETPKSKADWLYNAKLRILGLSVPVANAVDIGEWIPCSPKYVFAFDTSSRPSSLDTRIVSLDVIGLEARQTAAVRSCFRNIVDLAPDDPTLVFTPSRRHVMEMAMEIASLASQHSLEIYDARCKTTPGYKMPTQEQVAAGNLLPVLLRVDDVSILRPHLAHCSPAVAELLANGIGIFHDGLTAQEKRVVQHLYAARAIQVVVADAACCYELHNAFNSSLVLIVDTQMASHVGDHRSTNVKISSILHMAGRANVISLGKRYQARSTCVIYCAPSQYMFLQEFTSKPFTIESYLDTDFDRIMNSLIVNGSRRTRHEILDFCTWTFLYRRIRRNPHFYRLPLPTKEQVSEFLSELIENSLESLSEMGFIACDEDVDAPAEPLNLGIVAEHYQLMPNTVDMFHTALTAALDASKSGKSRFGLLEMIDILLCASEFDNVASIKPREASSLRMLANHLPLPITSQLTAVSLQGDLADIFNCTPSKVNVLLQAHLSRIPLTASAEADLNKVLPLATRLIAALMDISSSVLLLSPVLVGLEFSQMITMGVWGLGTPNKPASASSTLLQIPHISADLATLLQKKYEVSSVSDLLELDDSLRAQLLLSSWGVLPGPNGTVSLSNCASVEERTIMKSQMNDVAMFCNAYPDLTVEYKVMTQDDDIIAGEQGMMIVTLKKSDDDEEDEDEEEEEEEEIPITVAKRYPEPKVETWWLVLGSIKSNELWAMKKVVCKTKNTPVKLPFRISETEGLTNLKLFVLSDSYVGVDQEFDLKFKVLPAEA